MDSSIALPTIGIILTSAAIDAVNPCAIGVLILMISLIVKGKKSLKKLFIFGGLYILSIFATYLLAGLGLLYVFSSIPLLVTEYLSIFVAILVIIFGLFEIKDYFWYGRWFSLGIPAPFTKKIHQYAERISLLGV